MIINVTSSMQIFFPLFANILSNIHSMKHKDGFDEKDKMVPYHHNSSKRSESVLVFRGSVRLHQHTYLARLTPIKTGSSKRHVDAGNFDFMRSPVKL